MRTRKEVEHAFMFHVPADDSVIQDHEKVGAITRKAALQLFDLLPPCSEKTLVMRHIQMARMLANAAIALNQDPT